MKKREIIKKIILEIGGAESSWYAKLNGTRKIDLQTALKLKKKGIPLDIWDNDFWVDVRSNLTNIPKRGRKRKEEK